MTLGRRPRWGQTLGSGVTTVGGGQDRFPNTEALGGSYWESMAVSLDDIAADGTNNAEIEKVNESKFAANSQKIHDELLRRAQVAGAAKNIEKK